MVRKQKQERWPLPSHPTHSPKISEAHPCLASSQKIIPPQNSAPKIALPTIGRIVHVFGLISDGAGPDVPRAGIVCGAEPGQLTINASVWARSGDTFVGGVQNLLHASMPRHPGDLYWDWMDFQKGQAAKTEQLEERIDQMKAARDTSAGNEMGKLQAGAPSPVDGKR